MSQSVTLLGFDLQIDASMMIPDGAYPPFLKLPIRRKLDTKETDPTPSPEYPVAEYEHTGPIPGTYRRIS